MTAMGVNTWDLFINKTKKDEKQNEDSLRDFWDNIKCTNVHFIGVPEGERERTKENIWRDNS